jgi:hypothetical protein
MEKTMEMGKMFGILPAINLSFYFYYSGVQSAIGVVHFCQQQLLVEFC